MKHLVFLGCLLLVVGCENGPTTMENSMVSPPSVRVVGRDGLTLSKDAVRIVDASMQAGKLAISVEYSGGSKEHDFELYCARAISKSMPPKANLYLSHNANGDRAKALVKKDLVFDLSPMSELGASNIIIKLHGPGANEPVKADLTYTP